MFSSGSSSIVREDILKNVSEADILGYYLGVKTIPALINSPLRKDNHPSFALYSPREREVNYIDFSTGDGGGCMTLLQKLWGVSREEVYTKITKDLLKFGNTPVNNAIHKVTVSRKSTVSLNSKVREWEDYDIKYWESYGVSLDVLKHYDVYPISHKFITKDGKTYTFRAEKYAYTFVERKEGRVTQKFYQPFNKGKYKWQNSHDRSVLGLWSKLPKTGKQVCICSSVKDALCLITNLKIPCICLQGEGYSISETAVKELRRRFEHIYIILDNDAVGIKDAEKLAAETMFINVVIPSFEGGKDISDYFKCFGKEQFVKTFSSLIKEATYDYYNELPF